MKCGMNNLTLNGLVRYVERRLICVSDENQKVMSEAGEN